MELVLEPDHAMSHGTFRPKPQLLEYLQGLLGMPPTSLPGSRLLVAGAPLRPRPRFWKEMKGELFSFESNDECIVLVLV